MADKKQAYRLLTQGEDGKTIITYVDAQSGERVSKLTGYEIIEPSDTPHSSDLAALKLKPASQTNKSETPSTESISTDKVDTKPEEELVPKGETDRVQTDFSPDGDSTPLIGDNFVNRGSQRFGKYVESKDLGRKFTGQMGSVIGGALGAGIGGPIGGLIGMMVGRQLTTRVLDDIRSKATPEEAEYLGLPDFPDPPAPEDDFVSVDVAPVGAVERSTLPEIEGENFPEATFRGAAGTTVRSNPHDGIPISQPSVTPTPQSAPSVAPQPASVASSYASTESVQPAGAVQAIDSRFGRPVSGISLGTGQIDPMIADTVNPFSAIARNKPNKVSNTSAVSSQIDPFSTAVGGITAPVTTLQDNVPSNVPNSISNDNPFFSALRREQTRNPHDGIPTTSFDGSVGVGTHSINWGDINPDTVDAYTRGKLETAQAKLGFSLNITSGGRSHQYNKNVGGAKGSAHLSGQAVDISLRGLDDNQRASLVSTLGAVGDQGRTRIGAYSGNTGLHFDTRQHSTQNYGGVHPMFDTTIKAMDRAPSWFTTGLSNIGQTRQTMNALGAPAPQVNVQRNNPGAFRYDANSMGQVPAAYAASGQFNRSLEEKQRIGFTIAGELGPNTLRGLQNNDPTARAELANVMATIENRAHSTRYDGKPLDSVLTPSQYNSLSRSALNTTKNNWSSYNKGIMDAVEGFYSGRNKPTTPTATHYANYDVVTPSWDTSAQNKVKVGAHTFSTVTQAGTTIPEYQPAKTFQQKAQQNMASYATPTPDVQSTKPLNAVRAEEQAQKAVEEAQEKTSTFSSSMTTGFAGSTTGTSRTREALNNNFGFANRPSSVTSIGANSVRSGSEGGGGFMSNSEIRDARARGETVDSWGGLRETTSSSRSGGFAGSSKSSSSKSGKK